MADRVADKYELRRVLGEGSMGAVYEGVHVDLGKRLAIKLIHPEFCESAEVVARFRREARAASAVDSDYIAQIYDFGRDEARGLYMVIEYLEGEDLEARLQRERWISEEDTATIGLQVARGLAKAHAAGIVHRDLKPANIFLTKRDDASILAKVLDFGISKFEPERGPASIVEPTLTAMGTTLGTPQYMSPEQCEGKLALDVRTDVWSLCAVLYEMIAGEPAVSDQGGHIAAMQRIVREDMAPLASRAEWVSPALAGVIDAGLVRDRERRVQSAGALVARLLAAFPGAAARPSVGMLVHRKTDISELGPPSEAPPPTEAAPEITEAAPETQADPAQALAAAAAAAATGAAGVAPSAPAAVAGAAAVPTVKLSDTGNPNTPRPPSSANPPSSEDGVAIFARGEALPRELLELRKKAGSSKKPE
jgi:serine/threonine-protein kinase